MCKLGDIIVVESYLGENKEEINRHSFIVISDEASMIQGLAYDLVTTVISSFKGKQHKKEKLSYKGNKEIKSFIKNEREVSMKKDSYIKADKLFYFNKDKLKYYVFGRISDDLLEELFELIIELREENKLIDVKDNL